jgi:hypothetical protein
MGSKSLPPISIGAARQLICWVISPPQVVQMAMVRTPFVKPSVAR